MSSAWRGDSGCSSGKLEKVNGMNRGKKGKAARKKLFSSAIIFLLVGGLLLSVTAGFLDFLGGGKKLAYPPEEDEFAAGLEEQAALLERAWQEDPADAGKQAALGSAYYELAMYYQGRGLQEGKKYARKGLALLLPVAEGGAEESSVTLKIALLSAFIEKDALQAEKYFLETLALQENYPEAHFYYGLFLASRERDAEARMHWGIVLQQVEEGSPLAQAARQYLQFYAEKDGVEEEGEK